jgi:hypothetical protein
VKSLVLAVLSIAILLAAQSAYAAPTERTLTINIDGKESVVKIETYDFQRAISVGISDTLLNAIMSSFGRDTFVFYNTLSKHVSGDASITIAPTINVGQKLEVQFRATMTEVPKPPPAPEKEPKEGKEVFDHEPTAGISVAMKIKKKLTLLSIKNNEEVPIYSVIIKSTGGDIRFVKAMNWDRSKVDSGTVIVQTDDRPITEGRNKIVLIIGDTSSGLEWSAFDENGVVLSSGAMIPK